MFMKSIVGLSTVVALVAAQSGGTTYNSTIDATTVDASTRGELFFNSIS